MKGVLAFLSLCFFLCRGLLSTSSSSNSKYGSQCTSFLCQQPTIRKQTLNICMTQRNKRHVLHRARSLVSPPAVQLYSSLASWRIGENECLWCAPFSETHRHLTATHKVKQITRSPPSVDVKHATFDTRSLASESNSDGKPIDVDFNNDVISASSIVERRRNGLWKEGIHKLLNTNLHRSGSVLSRMFLFLCAARVSDQCIEISVRTRSSINPVPETCHWSVAATTELVDILYRLLLTSCHPIPTSALCRPIVKGSCYTTTCKRRFSTKGTGSTASCSQTSSATSSLAKG